MGNGDAVKIPFKYYLHDNYNSSERAEFILEQIESAGVYPDAGVGVDEFSELIGRPFYEVELNCLFDTETGKVEIVGVGKT